MIGVTLIAAASPTRIPRGSGRSSVKSATTMRARMMLTCPSRNVWRTGSSSTTGISSISAHHTMVRLSSCSHTARRDTAMRAKTAARLSNENAISATANGAWAAGAKSNAENGG